MEQKQPPIYHSCLQLSRLVFSITRHFPKKANYEEGAELRHASVEVVKECLLSNRSQRGSQERKIHQERMSDALTLIEALVGIINEEKMCVQTKDGQKWERLISSKAEVKIQTSIITVSKQLYGWMRC
jgi:hypothetical protein